MRVRITKRPPASDGTDAASFRVGRVYNLRSELASALMLEGYAQMYESEMGERPAGAERRTRQGTLWNEEDRGENWYGGYSAFDDDGDA